MSSNIVASSIILFESMEGNLVILSVNQNAPPSLARANIIEYIEHRCRLAGFKHKDQGLTGEHQLTHLRYKFFMCNF